MFKRTAYPGADALVAVVPKNQATPAELKQTVDDAGEGRWFPFEGGWKVLCPYTGQNFDPSLFVMAVTTGSRKEMIRVGVLVSKGC